MTDRELMQQALDALNNTTCMDVDESAWRQVNATIKALRARLAQCDAGEICLGCRVCPDAQPEPRTGDCLLTGVCAAEGHRIQKAQPEPEPEPYCWTWDKWISGGYWEAQYGWEPYRGEKRPQHVTDAKPLYTAPPRKECASSSAHDRREWQGLTDSERGEIFDIYGYGYKRVDVVAMSRAIEAKLKEKNAL